MNRHNRRAKKVLERQGLAVSPEGEVTEVFDTSEMWVVAGRMTLPDGKTEIRLLDIPADFGTDLDDINVSFLENADTYQHTLDVYKVKPSSVAKRIDVTFEKLEIINPKTQPDRIQFWVDQMTKN